MIDMSRMKIIKRISCLLFISCTLFLTGCGTNESQQAFEKSPYKKITIYRMLPANTTKSTTKKPVYGQVTITSKDNGKTIDFSGFYQFQAVHINTKDPNKAFRSHTVESFAKECGFLEYDALKKQTRTFPSSEIMNDRGFTVYFETSNYGGDLYLGKQFHYTNLKGNDAKATYDAIIHLLSKESFQEKDAIKETSNYALSLDYQTNAKTKTLFLGFTNYTYTLYEEMESFLYKKDTDFATVYDKLNKEEQSTPTQP